MKNLLAFWACVLVSVSTFADRLFLVGDATPQGWNVNTEPMLCTELIETAPDIFTWTGKLYVGDEGFKISTELNQWGDWHPSTDFNSNLDEVTSDVMREGIPDTKWKVSEDGIYTVTIDWNNKTISAVKETYELQKVDSVYQIGTAEDLFYFSQWISHNVLPDNAKAELTADIDYTAEKYKYASIGCVKAGGAFCGEFNGNGHKITINMADLRSHTGLFAYVNKAKITNLWVDGTVTMTSHSCGGGLGGLCGGVGTLIDGVLSTVTINDAQSGDGTIGGLFAVVENTVNIQNCAFLGSINAPNRDSNGGLVGWCGSGSNVTFSNCLVKPASVSWAGGAAVGRNKPTISNVYAIGIDNDTFEYNGSLGAAPTDAQMTNGEFCYLLNENVRGAAHWYQKIGTDAIPFPIATGHEKVYKNGEFYCDGVTSKGGDVSFGNTDAATIDSHVYGDNGLCTGGHNCHVGKEARFLDGYYRVETIGNLVWISDYVNSGNTDIEVIVDADVDQTGVFFNPIGTTTNPFIGSFNGMGHSITLAIDHSDSDYQGLFGVIGDGASMNSLKLKGYVKGNNYVGALAGSATGGSGEWIDIYEIANEANVTAAGKNGAAIVGVNMGGSASLYITLSYNHGNITSGSEGAAITGWSGNNAVIMNVYNTGVIKNGETNCTDFIRGNGYVDNCYALEGTATTKVSSFKQEDLASGKLCYLLDSYTQNLGEDDYPTFDHKKVYALYDGYGYANIDNMEKAEGTDDAILPSFMWGGSYKAYTWIADSGKDYDAAEHNKIWGVPAKQGDLSWYEPGFNLSAFSYGNSILPESWPETMSDIYVVRYFTVDGEISSALYMAVPHDDAPCEYYINGQKIWEGTEGANKDEIIRLTDAQKALVKTDGTVNVFAYHVHQNSDSRYADGGLYIAGDMVTAFNDEVKTLDMLIASAEAMPTDADLTAAITTAKAKSNYRGGMSAGRDLLATAMKVAAVDKQENVFKGSAPKDGGQYYLYNVGAKRYLAGGGDYGTHAAVNFAAQVATFTANGEGFLIHTNIRNGSDALNHNGYVDCEGDGDTWFLNEVSTGVYTISTDATGEGNTLLGYNGAYRGNWWQVDTDCYDAANPNNQWVLVTKDERDALLQTASSENPVDATYYIHAAGFDRYLVSAGQAFPFTSWAWNNGGDGGWEPDFVYEVSHAGNTEMSQTLTGLPAGRYIVSVQGYYRDGDNINFAGTANDAYMFAGDEQCALPNICEEADKYPIRGNNNGGHGIVPDSSEDAANYFEVGLYKASVEVEVGTDGNLIIGARKITDASTNDWMVLDNFRLTCIEAYPLVVVGESEWTTYVAPKDLDYSMSAVAAYAVEVKPSYVELTLVPEAKKGTALVINGPAAGNFIIPTIENATENYNNDLIAATENITADGTQYIFANVDGVVGFYKATAGTTIAKGTGYLVIPSSSDDKSFLPIGDDESTSIKDVEGSSANTVIYNLSGQRLVQPVKGVNIIGGKKVVVKH